MDCITKERLSKIVSISHFQTRLFVTHLYNSSNISLYYKIGLFFNSASKMNYILVVNESFIILTQIVMEMSRHLQRTKKIKKMVKTSLRFFCKTLYVVCFDQQIGGLHLVRWFNFYSHFFANVFFFCLILMREKREMRKITIKNKRFLAGKKFAHFAANLQNESSQKKHSEI